MDTYQNIFYHKFRGLYNLSLTKRDKRLLMRSMGESFILWFAVLSTYQVKKDRIKRAFRSLAPPIRALTVVGLGIASTFLVAPVIKASELINYEEYRKMQPDICEEVWKQVKSDGSK